MWTKELDDCFKANVYRYVSARIKCVRLFNGHQVVDCVHNNRFSVHVLGDDHIPIDSHASDGDMMFGGEASVITILYTGP